MQTNEGLLIAEMSKTFQNVLKHVKEVIHSTRNFELNIKTN